jgi:hypothetical protein
MSPGFWLRHAALAWGRELVRCGIHIAVDLDEEMSGPGGDPLRGRPFSASRPRPGPLPDPGVPPTGFEPVPPP